MNGDKDCVVYMHSPKRPFQYDSTLPRIDLVFTMNDSLIGHTAVLSYKRSKYKQTIGWQCVFCEKVHISHSWQHKCQKGYNCIDCNRIQIAPNSNYLLYPSTNDMFCDSRIGDQDLQKCCLNCHVHFMTDNCFRFHLKVNALIQMLRTSISLYSVALSLPFSASIL